MNACIQPRKYIDYDELEKSRVELKEAKAAIDNAKKNRTKEQIALEKKDYKRFMKYGSKQLVFYSERNGFYKYFKDVIEYIANNFASDSTSAIAN